MNCKFIFSFLTFVLTTSFLHAQDFKITMNAPENVSVNEQFRVEVSVNAQNVNIPIPDFKDFRVFGRSQSNSMSIINGDMTVKNSAIFTIMATKEGTFKIPAVQTEYKGKTYTSNSLTIILKKGTNIFRIKTILKEAYKRLHKPQVICLLIFQQTKRRCIWANKLL